MKPNTKIASLQRHWAANAMRDAKYNENRASQVVNPELKEMYRQEARWDIWWDNRRLAIARKYDKK